MVLDMLTSVGKVGLALYVAGSVIFTVGFSVPYWIVDTRYRNTDHRVGLWENCYRKGCTGTVSSDFKFLDLDGPPSWYRGTQALACLALIALIADFIVRLLYLCGKPKKFLLISMLLDCAACVLAILAAVVFGSEVEKYAELQLHFGFAFDIIGGILLGGAALCFLVEYCRHR